MSYLVLARKWRPMTFDDLVGQEHVSRTLSNAIQSGRLAHAFLFTGVRGVGKTTSARILAKSLNCEQGPTISPCLKCPACLEIANSSDMDVQEIDGASYNGVDEVRRLQESLPYRPSRDRFKVVIVDEVHMLTQNAWNAFLKTLEEPPPHVKFIFATTEVHKVPVTILSRCQRYDFKLISVQTIAKRLRFVLDQEHIEADEAALMLLAREAAGSMRDAMSLLDQAIAWGGEKLIGEEIAQVLGVAGRGVLHELVSSLVQGDTQACLQTVAKLADNGYDLVQIARDTMEHLRDLVVVKLCKEPGTLVDLTADELTLVRQVTDSAEVDDLLRIHLGFSKGFDQLVHAPQVRSALEMLLVRLSRRPPLLPIDGLVTKLTEMERRLGARASTSLSGSTMVSAGAPGPRSAGMRGEGPEPRAFRSERVTAIGSARAAAVAIAEPMPEIAPPAPRMLRPEPERRPTPLQRVQPEPQAQPSPSQPEPFERTLVSASEPDLAAIAKEQREWRQILDRVREANAGLASVLEHAVPLRVDAEEVRLGIEPDSFYERQAREEKAVDLLTRSVRAHFGQPTLVSFSLDAGPPSAPTVFEVDEASRKARFEARRRRLLEHPLVVTAQRELGALIQNVKVPPEE